MVCTQSSSCTCFEFSPVSLRVSPPLQEGENPTEIVINAHFVPDEPFTTPDDDPPAPDSPLVKLLKSGRVPEPVRVRSWT